MSKDLSSLITIKELKKSIEITIHEKKNCPITLHIKSIGDPHFSLKLSYNDCEQSEQSH